MDKEQGKRWRGHLTALIVIMMWGTTFVSTKVLLRSFSPLEILFFRILLAYGALWAIHPHKSRFAGWKTEGLYLAAGVCGVTAYFLLENVALQFSTASNVSIVLSVAPMFTAVAAHFLLRDERLYPRFFVGFAVAIAGVCLVSLNGNLNLKLNPVGDLLAVLAALSFGLYTVLIRKLNDPGRYPEGLAPHSAACTRRVFFYGLLTMVPVFLVTGIRPQVELLLQPVNLLNILYLGLGASAAGFVAWNWTIGVLGATRTNAYIYLQPVAAIVVSMIVLHEVITPLAVAGTALTLGGLYLSQSRGKMAVKDKIGMEKE